MTANDGKFPICVNLYGAPGAGKSTMAALVFSKLKMKNVNCELVTEFAKDKVWENNDTALSNQIYVFAKQYYRMSRCSGKVDVLITDSPLLLSSFYNRDHELQAPIEELIAKISARYPGMSYFLNRVKKYNPVGRLQTEKESDEYSVRIKDLLVRHDVDFTELDGDEKSSDVIVDEVMKRLENAERV